MQVLDEAVWRARAAAHRERVAPWTGPHRERRRRGEPHPVLDLLFTYYSLRPARLEQWQPGPGVALAGGAPFLARPGYVRDDALGPGVVRLDPDALSAAAQALISRATHRRVDPSSISTCPGGAPYAPSADEPSGAAREHDGT